MVSDTAGSLRHRTGVFVCHPKAVRADLSCYDACGCFGATGLRRKAETAKKKDITRTLPIVSLIEARNLGIIRNYLESHEKAPLEVRKRSHDRRPPLRRHHSKSALGTEKAKRKTLAILLLI